MGPWSADALQGSAYGGLLVRALERSDSAARDDAGTAQLRSLATGHPRADHDVGGPAPRRPQGADRGGLAGSRTASPWPAARRCSSGWIQGLHRRAFAMVPPARGPEAGRVIPPHVKAWSPFFTGVDTRVVEGDLLEPGPAAAWFNLGRALVGGEENSPFVHAVSAADLASGISAVVDLRAWSFINADLTIGVLARSPAAVDLAERRDHRGRGRHGSGARPPRRPGRPVRDVRPDAPLRAPAVRSCVAAGANGPW